MRASHLFFPTLREAPADAEAVSHRLLLRAGFIRRLAAGVSSYLPLGWRVHTKISAIVREEMNAIGGQEVFMPVLIPKELLEETGRANVDVLFALKDRNRRDFCLGFTHEEVITDIARAYINSWKQLPLILYQIQTKFRDEPRPRGGLLRGREFTMKDSYSFDLDEAGLDRSFQLHLKAYERIFTRCGLNYLVVDADSGDIGGSQSNEFMILADSGEDTVLHCDLCGYAANAERAEIGTTEQIRAEHESTGEAEERVSPQSYIVSTPGAHTVAQVCDFLKVEPTQLIKTIIVTVGGQPAAALVRGDRDLNLGKLGRFLNSGPVALADAATVERVTGAPVGFAGPVGLQGVRIVADRELQGTVNMVTGANADDAHRVDVTPGIDFPIPEWADIRVAVAGDRCPQPGCAGHFQEARGIEVAHIFQLGTKYSHAMAAKVQLESGQLVDIEMGCYGLGISRTMAAAVEAHHDKDGIVWPISIAPFEVVLLLVNHTDSVQRAAAEEIYAEMQARGIDVLYDDRAERSGVKFKDADLIGCPIRIVVGRALAQGQVEVTLRADKVATHIPRAEITDHVIELIAKSRV